MIEYPHRSKQAPGETLANPQAANYPGKTLGAVGLVFAALGGLLGFILCLVALGQSRRAGYRNTPAKVGVVLGIVYIALFAGFLVLSFVVSAVNGHLAV